MGRALRELHLRRGGLILLPLIRQPLMKLTHRRLEQVGEQLRVHQSRDQLWRCRMKPFPNSDKMHERQHEYTMCKVHDHLPIEARYEEFGPGGREIARIHWVFSNPSTLHNTSLDGYLSGETEGKHQNNRPRFPIWCLIFGHIPAYCLKLGH